MRLWEKPAIVLIVAILFLLLPKNSLAAFSFKIDNINTTSVNSIDQEVTLNVSITNLPSDSYFRAEWQKSSGSSYFGLSQNNNGDWVKVDTSANCADYYKISQTASSSAALKTKIGEDAVLDNGTYTLKVRRYTSSCASSSDSDPVSIEVNLPTPIPTQTPAPTANPTSTPSKTQTPSPTKQITPSPTTLPKVTPHATSLSSNSPSPSPSSEVLAAKTTEEANIPTPTPVSQKQTLNNFPLIPVGLAILGTIFIAIALIPIARNMLKEYNVSNVPKKDS